MAIHFYDEEVQSKLIGKRKLKTFIQKKINEYLDVKSIEINFIFCTDDYLLEINQEYLNHDTFTDIITFDLSEEEDSLTSEIYISIERVKENAEKYMVFYLEELHRVIFHGILHLCGFK